MKRPRLVGPHDVSRLGNRFPQSTPPALKRPSLHEMPDQPASRTLYEPHRSRLSSDDPHRAEILSAHREAVLAGEAGYIDPVAGLFVFTAAYLAERGTCCDARCRHCPYLQ